MSVLCWWKLLFPLPEKQFATGQGETSSTCMIVTFVQGTNLPVFKIFQFFSLHRFPKGAKQ